MDAKSNQKFITCVLMYKGKKFKRLRVPSYMFRKNNDITEITGENKTYRQTTFKFSHQEEGSLIYTA